MIRLDVRSMNGRPRASTPFTVNGTACTMRELRRLRSSSPLCMAFSEAISRESSTCPFLRSSMSDVLSFFISSVLCNLAVIGFLGRRSPEETPCLFGHPDGPHQKINRPLEKGGVITLDLVAQKQKHPAAHKQRSAPDPFPENQQYDPRENQRDSD